MAEDRNKPMDNKATATPPPPPRPAPKLSVTSAGVGGKYRFIIQVTDKNTGVGVLAEIVMVDDTNAPKHFPTDDTGYLEIGPISFSTEEEEFFFMVKGSDESLKVTLNGPEQPEPPPREKIRPVPGGLKANMENVRIMLEKRKKSI